MVRATSSRLGVSIALLALFLAACSNQGATVGTEATGDTEETSETEAIGDTAGTSGGGGESVQITFATFETPERVAQLEAAIEVWEEQNPNISVELQSVPLDSALPSYTRQANAGEGPDLFHAFLTWPPLLASSGLALELSELDESSPLGDGLDEYLGLDVVSHEGGVYGVPWTVDSFAFGYNPEAFESAGAEFPSTWEDLPEVAQTLTDAQGSGAFCLPAASTATSSVWHFLNAYIGGQTGHGLVYQDGDEVSTATAEELGDMLGFVGGFFEAGTAPSGLLTVETAGGPEIQGGLVDGRCDIAFLDPISFAGAVDENSALLSSQNPSGSEGIAPRMGGRSLVVNPNSEHPEETWEFVTYLNSLEVFTEHYTGFFPADSSVRPAAIEAQFGEVMDGFLANLPEATTYSDYVALVNNSSMWAATTTALGSVTSGQLSPEEAADQLVSELERLVEEGPVG